MGAFASTITRAVAVFLTLLAFAATGHARGADEPEPPVIEAEAAENSFYIEPDFEGKSVVIFGAIDRERIKSNTFDLAITVRGPSRTMTVWKKERRGAIWVNAKSYTFAAVPSFYAVLTTRPIAYFAQPEELRAHQIGFDHVNLAEEEGPAKGDGKAFREALIRIQESQRVFVKDETAVELSGRSLFRARVFLPAAAGPGLYRADVYLFENGRVVGKAVSRVRVRKVGVESFLSSASAERPMLYGFGAVFLAAIIGLGASVMFRR